MNIQNNKKPLFIEEYDYSLPDERIAKYPLEQRDLSKLLIYRRGKILEEVFKHAINYLPENSLLVYNNTKVIHARMLFKKNTGASIEIFCLEPINPADYALSLGATNGCTWKCMIGNLKKWKQGSLIKSIKIDDKKYELKATLLSSKNNDHIVDFQWDNDGLSFSEILEYVGELPIPPYLNRKTEEGDEISYQTVYSKMEGSVAAPTAGLHFTEKVLESIKKKGIQTAELTLHVGAGTFHPVKTQDVSEHKMHTEMIEVSSDTIKKLLDFKGNIIAVGTTSVRTLESLYYIGVQLINANYQLEGPIRVEQWEPYMDKTDISSDEALQAVLNYLQEQHLDVLHAYTEIIILPGYEFKLIKGMFTNFHQPKSTLLLLVSAFVGKDWKVIYDYAMNHKFRFLSYGDSSLLLK